ncbi:MAG: hypothetical protein IJY85_10660 [Ruminococcus sp.]|nr:hypothetical protein [Ruminococcus sp.]
MPAAVIAGTLLLCLLLLLLTVSEILPEQEEVPDDLFTVLPLLQSDSAATVRRRIGALAWQDGCMVGMVILLVIDCDEEVLNYCERLCLRRNDLRLCRLEELETLVRSHHSAVL